MKGITEIIKSAYAVWETENDVRSEDITYNEELYELISEKEMIASGLPYYIKDIIRYENDGVFDENEKVSAFETKMESGELVTWYHPESWD